MYRYTCTYIQFVHCMQCLVHIIHSVISASCTGIPFFSLLYSFHLYEHAACEVTGHTRDNYIHSKSSWIILHNSDTSCLASPNNPSTALGAPNLVYGLGQQWGAMWRKTMPVQGVLWIGEYPLCDFCLITHFSRSCTIGIALHWHENWWVLTKWSRMPCTIRQV